MLFRLAAVLSLAILRSSARFTAEDLIGSPQRGPALPNKAGTHVIYPSSEYSFETHSSRSWWTLVDLQSGQSSELYPGSSIQYALWLGDGDAVLFTNASSAGGGTDFWIAPRLSERAGVHRAATVASPVINLKIHATTWGKPVTYLFSANARPDGTLYDPTKAVQPYSSGRVYRSLFVRHWDVYITPEKSSLFAGTLSVSGGVYTSVSGPRNLLPPPPSGFETPIPPFGGGGDFDISADGQFVTFISKTPTLNPGTNTQSLVYIVPADGSKPPYAVNDPGNKNSPPARGASASPRFSPDGNWIAYLQMAENKYESDINRIYVARRSQGATVSAFRAVAPSWDVSPQDLKWSADSRSLYSGADNIGRRKLYRIAVDSGHVDEVWGKHSVDSMEFLPKGRLLLSLSSFTSSPRSYVFDPSKGSLDAVQARPVQEKDLSPSQVEEFWFPGADVKVHGFIIKPSNFNKASGRKTKMAFIIHGGPQSAWDDSWSGRWSMAFFAEHGYIVVAVNPTGSTGYGQKFVDDIRAQYGGKPYIDLVKSIEYLESNPKYNFIDFDNAVALGSSFGGYMINYIQGMPLGRKFKALVCHDGVFSTAGLYSSDELWFPRHEFEGTPWTNSSSYERFNPARLVANWATPQMTIHSDLDYRLPISEGLAVFNIMQELGIPSMFLNFPDENHWILKPENRLMWYNEVMGWIDKWTGGPSAQ